MKKIILAILSIGLIVGCNKKEDVKVNTPSEIKKTEYQVQIELMANDSSLKVGSYSYTNASKNNYSVAILKMLLSKPVAVYTDGTTDTLNEYLKCDVKDVIPTSFKVKIPDGKTLKSISIGFGVDPKGNHTGAQEGALDPSHGMFWTWNTGYIFFIHEGNYFAKDSKKKYLLYHYGTDEAYRRINLDLGTPIVSNDKVNFKIIFDLNGLYNGSTPIDFNNNDFHQSTGAADDEWMGKLKNNIPNAFIIKTLKD